MSFALDANVVVDLIRGVRAVRERLDQVLLSGAEVFVSTIVVEELEFGARMSRRPEASRDAYSRVVAPLIVTEVSEADAIAMAEYRAMLEASGKRMTAFDGLISGHAHARGWVLVTADRKITDNAISLSIENWRDPE